MHNCRVDVVVSMGGVLTVLMGGVSMGSEMAGDSTGGGGLWNFRVAICIGKKRKCSQNLCSSPLEKQRNKKNVNTHPQSYHKMYMGWN